MNWSLEVFFPFREYIVYLVPILMLLFIGSLVVALLCVRIRSCDFGQFARYSQHPSTIPNTNGDVVRSGDGNGNTGIQIPSGEMVVMTELDVVPTSTVVRSDSRIHQRRAMV